MFLIMILWGLYHKENNLIHFKTVHLKEIQNCVEIHCQRNVSLMRFYHLYLQPQKIAMIQGLHFNLVGELLWLGMDLDYLLGWLLGILWLYWAYCDCKESWLVNEDFQSEATGTRKKGLREETIEIEFSIYIFA